VCNSQSFDYEVVGLPFVVMNRIDQRMMMLVDGEDNDVYHGHFYCVV
jgi:hypothetical protein